MEFVSNPKSVSSLSSENDKKGVTKRSVGNDTSFGLLPSGAFENCTLYNTAGHQILGNVDSSRMAIFGVSRLQPPTPDDIVQTNIIVQEQCDVNVEQNSHPKPQLANLEEPSKGPISLSRPSSQISNNLDDSIGTVIRKRSNQISPHLLMFSPELVEQENLRTPTKENHYESLDKSNPLVRAKEATSYLGTNDDMLNTPDAMDFNFMTAPPQEFGENLHLNEEFDNLHLDNADFINAEEEANQEAYRFIQEEEMQISNSSCHHHQNEWSGYFGVVNDSGKVSDVGKVVSESEIMVLLGENGTGKTTYIRMMAGKLEPDSGTGMRK